MRLTGPNAFGPPTDLGAAGRVLQTAIADGVNHIDTAQFYGPEVVNELIRDALSPYPADLVIVSKVGARRDGRGRVLADDEPQQLRRSIEANLRTLAVDTLPVVNLRLMRDTGPDTFFDDQLAAMVRARDDGLIGAVGLSNVTVAHLLHALQTTEIACVQNLYHLLDRASQPVLDACMNRDIAFVPFGSLGFGGNGPRSVVGNRAVVEEASRLGLFPAHVALAWALALAPNVLVIPGASSVDHLRENLKASDVSLDDEAMKRLSAL
jgi:aryl-alcohol dehydrogenase-like predicted oxidoreductase